VIKHLVSIQSREVLEIRVRKGSVSEGEHTSCEQPAETGLCRLGSFPKWLRLGDQPEVLSKRPIVSTGKWYCGPGTWLR